MFVPEVHIRDTKTYMEIYEKATVRLYSIQHGYAISLKLQCYDGVCVYTHSPQKYNHGGKSFTVLDEVFQVPEQDSEEKYETYKRRKNEALEAFIREVVKRKLEQLQVVEGEFVSVTLIAEEQ